MKNNRIFAKFSLIVGALSALTALTLSGCASTTPAPVVNRGGQVAKDSYVVKAGDTLHSIARDHGMDFRELIALNSIENPDSISVGKVLKVKVPTSKDGSTAVASSSPINTGNIETRPIGNDLSSNATSNTSISSSNASASNTDSLKREPKGGKESYSEQALAQAQNVAKTTESAPPKTDTPVAAASSNIDWAWPAKGKVIATYSEGNKGLDIAGKAGDPVLASAEGKVVYSGTGLRGYGKLVIIKHNATYLSAYAHNQNILVKENQSVSKGQKIAEMGNSDADQVKLHFEIRMQGKTVDPQKHLPPR